MTSPTWEMSVAEPPKKTRSPGSGGVSGERAGPAVELCLGHPGEGDSGRPVGGLDQPRAVPAAVAGAAPQVRRAELASGEADGRGRRCGQVRVRAERPGEDEDLLDVGGRVVVGEERTGQAGGGAGAVGAQEAGRRVDGVDRVVGGGGRGPSRPDRGVGGEGGRLELHRSLGPGRVGPAGDPGGVGPAAVTLHPADGGQHRPVEATAGGGGLLVERLPRCRDGRPAARVSLGERTDGRCPPGPRHQGHAAPQAEGHGGEARPGHQHHSDHRPSPSARRLWPNGRAVRLARSETKGDMCAAPCRTGRSSSAASSDTASRSTARAGWSPSRPTATVRPPSPRWRPGPSGWPRPSRGSGSAPATRSARSAGTTRPTSRPTWPSPPWGRCCTP